LPNKRGRKKNCRGLGGRKEDKETRSPQNSKEERGWGGKVLKRDQEKGRGRERKTVETRVKRSCVLPRTHGRAERSMNGKGNAEWKKDRCERSGEQEKRVCFIKCVARGKSARQFSGAKAVTDNARDRV